MPRVAIIDNDADVLFVLQAVFHDAGWEVLSSRRVDAAVGLLHDEKTDVILLDLWFHGPINGWDLLRYLKSDMDTRDIPVVVLSGPMDHLDEVETWLSDHGVGLVHKPFDVGTLTAVVQATLLTAPEPSSGRHWGWN